MSTMKTITHWIDGRQWHGEASRHGAVFNPATGVQTARVALADAALVKVAGYIDAGVREGARLLVDGRGVAVDGAANGYWLGPTLFDHVTEHMSIYRDEIFGPVLCVSRVSSYGEALRLVNEHPYGNGTALFTRDGSAARRFQHEVEVGMVGINVPIPVPVAYYSFGGWKASLCGDSHAHGSEGVQFFTRGKVVTSRWPDPTQGGINLGFPRNS